MNKDYQFICLRKGHMDYLVKNARKMSNGSYEFIKIEGVNENNRSYYKNFRFFANENTNEYKIINESMKYKNLYVYKPTKNKKSSGYYSDRPRYCFDTLIFSDLSIIGKYFDSESYVKNNLLTINEERLNKNELVMYLLYIDMDYYGNDDVHLLELGEFNTPEEIHDIINSFISNNNDNIPISGGSCIEFFYKLFLIGFHNEIVISTLNPWYESKHLLNIKCDKKFNIEMNTIENIFNSVSRNTNSSIINFICNLFYECSNSNVYRKELIKTLINSKYFKERHYFRNYFDLEILNKFLDNLDLSENEKYEFCIEIENSLVKNEYLKSRPSQLLEIVPSNIINNNIEYYYNYLASSEIYDCGSIEFFIKHPDCKEKKNINRRKFLKASSLLSYNQLMGMKYDENIEFLANTINESGNLNLSCKMQLVTTFIKSYSLNELKSLNLDPLCDSIVDKLLSKFSYEISYTNVNCLSKNDDDNEKIQYLCDKIVDRMTVILPNTHSRVKLIYDSKNMNKGNSLFHYLYNSVNKSNDIKILKSLAKLGI